MCNIHGLHGRLQYEMLLTSIEIVLPELLRQLHEVTLHELDLLLQSSVFCEPPRPVDLEVVVVEANNLDVGKARNLPRWAADTTANIENTHTGTKSHLGSQIMLMAGETTIE